MNELIKMIIGTFDMYYISAVTFTTWIFLMLIVKRPNARVKIIINLGIGLVYALIWYYYVNVELNVLLASFPASIMMYSWIIKRLMKKFNISYDNNKGIV